MRSMTATQPSLFSTAADRRLGVRPAAGALAGVAVSVAFTLLAVGVLTRFEPLDQADRGMADAFHAWVSTSPGLVRAFEVLALVTHPNAMRAVAAVIAFTLWRQGRRRLVAWLVVTMAIGGLLSPLLKVVVGRDRPTFDAPVSAADGYAFPSGHALNSMLFAACLVVLAHPHSRRSVRAAVRGVAGVIVVVTGVDRVALGVHFVSDVVAGWMVALATVCLTTAAFARSRALDHRPPAEHPATGPDPARRFGRDGGSGRPPRTVALVLNPVKVGDAADLAERLREQCRRAGLAEPLVVETTAEDPGHGQTEEVLAAGADVVLVAGGDGTVRVVAEALTGRGVPLAVLPQGTGNLLARNLGLPLDLDDALAAALHGEDRLVDVCRLEDPWPDCDDSVFTIMAGAGFDAAMMREAPEGLKDAVGWPAYLVGGLRGLRRGHARVEVSLDGGPPLHARVRTVLIANVGSLQGGLRLAPDARPDDGLLDVVLVAPRRVLDWVVLLARATTGRRRQDRRLRSYQARSVRIRMRHPQPRQLDGDLIADGTVLAARIEPGALVVRFPPAVSPA